MAWVICSVLGILFPNVDHQEPQHRRRPGPSHEVCRFGDRIFTLLDQGFAKNQKISLGREASEYLDEETMRMKQLIQGILNSKIEKIKCSENTSESCSWNPTNQTDADKKALHFLEAIKEAWEFLKLKCVNRNDMERKSNVIAMFELSDILLLFLAECENFSLVSGECLNRLINDQASIQAIFNYITGIFPWDVNNNMRLYLNLNFEKSIQENPFNNEIKLIFKYFSDKTWRKLNYLYLGGQMQFYKYKFTERISELKDNFLEEASTDGDHKTLGKRELARELFSLVNINTNIEKTSLDLVEYKFLYDMMDFMVKYYSNLIPHIFVSNFKDPVLQSPLDNFIKSIYLFSKVVHLRLKTYIEVLKNCWIFENQDKIKMKIDGNDSEEILKNIIKNILSWKSETDNSVETNDRRLNLNLEFPAKNGENDSEISKVQSIRFSNFLSIWIKEENLLLEEIHLIINNCTVNSILSVKLMIVEFQKKNDQLHKTLQKYQQFLSMQNENILEKLDCLHYIIKQNLFPI